MVVMERMQNPHPQSLRSL